MISGLGGMKLGFWVIPNLKFLCLWSVEGTIVFSLEVGLRPDLISAVDLAHLLNLLRDLSPPIAQSLP